MIAFFDIALTLEHTAVDEDSGVADFEEIGGTGHCTSGAEEGDFHENS